MGVRRVAARVSRLRPFCEDQALAVWHEEGGHLVGRELRGEVGRSWVPGESGCADDLLQPGDLVHGDEFTFSGTQVESEKIRGLFKKWYDVKDRGIMGSGTRDIKEVVILGRTLEFTEMGLEYTADGKHRDAILEELGPEPDKMDEPGDEDELLKEDVTSFRSVVARLNFLGMDRSRHPVWREGVVLDDVEADPEVVETSEAAGNVPCGQGGHDVGVQGGRLDGHGRRVCGLGLGRRQAAAQEHIRRPGDRTQRGRSLSSAEAEYYAIVTGVAEALAVQALAEEMGWKMSVRVHTDSSAAKAVASRRGLGKLRHIELKYLWVQELVQDQRIAINEINGLDNPADCLTKPKDFKCFEPLFSRFGARWRCRK